MTAFVFPFVMLYFIVLLCVRNIASALHHNVAQAHLKVVKHEFILQGDDTPSQRSIRDCKKYEEQVLGYRG